MDSLRNLLHRNSWVAATLGVSVESAIAAFERGGCDVDSCEPPLRWKSLSKVREKLQAALAGTRVWTKADSPPPGAIDYVAPETLVSGRRDDEAMVLRVRGRWRDQWTVEQIAEAEQIEPERVSEILKQEGVDVKRRKKRGSAPVEPPQSELDEVIERIEKLRQYYEQLGRPFPQHLANVIRRCTG